LQNRKNPKGPEKKKKEKRLGKKADRLEKK